MRYIRYQVVAVYFVLACIASVAQESATVSLADLIQNPLKFDGRLIRVRAWIELGWEGDNYLVDRPAMLPRTIKSRRPVSVWFYSKAGHERQVWNVINAGDRRIQGTVTGYFHFVPDQKSRMQDVFDPGPLQLEAIGVSDIGTAAQQIR